MESRQQARVPLGSSEEVKPGDGKTVHREDDDKSVEDAPGEASATDHQAHGGGDAGTPGLMAAVGELVSNSAQTLKDAVLRASDAPSAVVAPEDETAVVSILVHTIAHD